MIWRHLGIAGSHHPIPGRGRKQPVNDHHWFVAITSSATYFSQNTLHGNSCNSWINRLLLYPWIFPHRMVGLEPSIKLISWNLDNLSQIWLKGKAAPLEWFGCKNDGFLSMFPFTNPMIHKYYIIYIHSTTVHTYAPLFAHFPLGVTRTSFWVSKVGFSSAPMLQGSEKRGVVKDPAAPVGPTNPAFIKKWLRWMVAKSCTSW